MKATKFGAKAKITALFLFIMMIFAGQAFSGSIPLFGPKVYNKGKGAPVTYTDRFMVPPGVGGVRLLVKNGLSDAGEVKNVSIVLNGTEVISSADLRSTSNALKQVTLRPENVISVTLKGQGGNAIFVQLDGELPGTEPIDPNQPIPPVPPMPY